ncbi:MAG TPA: 23S rRNA (guanosine(2251)-2'-O)-methyltransferase RlmB [Acidimicrobiia bacterium]
MVLAGYGNRVEGVHAVSAAIAAGRVLKLYVERGRRGRLEELLAGVDDDLIQLVDDVRSLADTDAPQGVVADCRPIVPVTLEQLAEGLPALLVLDHVEDPHNVGAAARSALAAGVSGMVVSARRAAPLSAATFKAAAGAMEHLPVSIVNSIPEALSRLKENDVWVVGLDASGDQSLFGLPLLTEPVAVVVGSEGAGLAELTRKRCDVVARIPMATDTESLNASVSAALASFEIMRVRSRRD